MTKLRDLTMDFTYRSKIVRKKSFHELNVHVIQIKNSISNILRDRAFSVFLLFKLLHQVWYTYDI